MDAADWNARYAAADLVWSASPNVWVEEALSGMPPGRAVDVAAGEGRHAVWLVDRGWQVLATDYSTVAVDRLTAIAADRLGDRAARLAAVVADATDPVPEEGPGGAGAAYDLALFSYLHLGRDGWREALGHAVAAVRNGGMVLVVAHALRNLAEGVGGPQDPDILLDPEDVVESVAGLPVVVESAEIRRRSVGCAEHGHRRDPHEHIGEGHSHHARTEALDTVVVLTVTRAD